MLLGLANPETRPKADTSQHVPATQPRSLNAADDLGFRQLRSEEMQSLAEAISAPRGRGRCPPAAFGTRQTVQERPQPLGQRRLDNIAGFFAELTAYFFESSTFAHDLFYPSSQT